MGKASGFSPATRVAAYPRVSTEEQKRHGLSIEAQTQALQDWADKAGLKVAGFYNDAGNSARKPYNKRPAMVRLLDDVKAGKIDLIIFTKLDRWFRNIAEYYKVQEILDAHNVAWKAIHEDYDTSTASGRLKINIMLSVAQDEADRDSERIRAVFEAKKERREPVTGNVPTGYKIEGKKVVKDPETEAAVNCFFETFLAYHSVGKAREEVAERFGISFSYQLASAMLQKEAYFGRFENIDGMCPAYISKEQYNEIQANRRRTERKTDKDRVYLFTGLIFCSECGRRLGARSHRYAVKSGGYHERISYNCAGKYRHTDCSNNVNIGELDIEDYLLEHIDEELNRLSFELDHLALAGQPAKNFQEERAKLRKKLSRLKDLYVDDIIDLDLYRKDYQALNAQLDALAAEENSAPASAPDIEHLRTVFYNGWREMYEGLNRFDKQTFWRMAIDKIIIYPTRQITVFFRF